ncbi:MAG: hypothetical protein LUI87_13220 [Lachnospiraceae bacterium]|nr:hypothetical protein [Lachnospiraceae bacterium]
MAASTISGLQRQLNEATGKIESLSRQMQKQREQMEKEQSRKLEALRREMNETVKQKGAEAEQKYQRLLEEYRRALGGELDARTSQMQAEYELLKERLAQAQKQWEEASERVAGEVRALKEHQEAKDEAAHADAAEKLGFLEEKLSQVRRLPCEVFRSGRLGIIEDTVRSAVSLLQRGMAGAVSGLAMSALSDARRLELEVEEGLDEWKTAFEDWERATEEAWRLLEEEAARAAGILEAPTEQIPAGKHDWVKDMDFWSGGELRRAMQELARHRDEIRAIREKTVEGYLAEGNPLSLEQLRQKREQVTDEIARQSSSFLYYLNAYRAYLDRLLLGEKVIDYLEDQELTFLSAGFAAALSSDLPEEWREWLLSWDLTPLEEEEDCRTVYCICFTDAEGDLLAASIRPVRDGGQVSNRIQYCAEISGSFGGEKFARDLLAILRAAGAEALRETEAARFCTASEEPEEIRLAEEEPSPSLWSEGKTRKMIINTVRHVARREDLS